MSGTIHAVHRLGVLVAATLVSLVVAAMASAMPLVPEGDPPIKVRPVHAAADSAGAVAGGVHPGGIDWSTAAVSAFYAAAIVLVTLAVAFAALRARDRNRRVVAPTA